MLSFITGALGFLGRLPGGALNLIDRRRQWATADRVEIDDSFNAEIASLKEDLADAEDDEERTSIKQEIKRVRQEQRRFYGARRDLLLSKSLVERMTPTGTFTVEGPPLPPPERQVLSNAAFVIARLEPPKTFDDHFLQGNAFYRAGDFDKALSSYNRALKLRPDDPDILTNRGMTLSELNRHEQALASFNRALKLTPEHPGALSNRGATLYKLHRCDEALAYFNRSLQLRPDDPGTLNNRAITFNRVKRHDEALADFNRSLQLRPDDPDTLYNRACTFSLMSRLHESLNQLKAVMLRNATFRKMAREEEDFANLWADLTLGPEFERLVAEPQD